MSSNHDSPKHDGPPMIPPRSTPPPSKKKRKRRSLDLSQFMMHPSITAPLRADQLKGPDHLVASSLPAGFPPELAFRALAAYSLIRTLSIHLRLSPFTPNVFLRALLLPYPNKLLGHVHVALLRVLLPALKMGYSYKERGHALCVSKRRRVHGGRWELRAGDNLTYLDGLTWPLFYDDYVHLTADELYARMHSSELQIDFRSILFRSPTTQEEQQTTNEQEVVVEDDQKMPALRRKGQMLPSRGEKRTSPRQHHVANRSDPVIAADSDSDSEPRVKEDSDMDDSESEFEDAGEVDDDDEDYEAKPRPPKRKRKRAPSKPAPAVRVAAATATPVPIQPRPYPMGPIIPTVTNGNRSVVPTVPTSANGNRSTTGRPSESPRASRKVEVNKTREFREISPLHKSRSVGTDASERVQNAASRTEAQPRHANRQDSGMTEPPAKRWKSQAASPFLHSPAGMHNAATSSSSTALFAANRPVPRGHSVVGGLSSMQAVRAPGSVQAPPGPVLPMSSFPVAGREANLQKPPLYPSHTAFSDGLHNVGLGHGAPSSVTAIPTSTAAPRPTPTTTAARPPAPAIGMDQNHNVGSSGSSLAINDSEGAAVASTNGTVKAVSTETTHESLRKKSVSANHHSGSSSASLSCSAPAHGGVGVVAVPSDPSIAKPILNGGKAVRDSQVPSGPYSAIIHGGEAAKDSQPQVDGRGLPVPVAPKPFVTGASAPQPIFAGKKVSVPIIPKPVVTKRPAPQPVFAGSREVRAPVAPKPIVTRPSAQVTGGHASLPMNNVAPMLSVSDVLPNKSNAHPPYTSSNASSSANTAQSPSGPGHYSALIQGNNAHNQPNSVVNVPQGFVPRAMWNLVFKLGSPDLPVWKPSEPGRNAHVVPSEAANAIHSFISRQGKNSENHTKDSSETSDRPSGLHNKTGNEAETAGVATDSKATDCGALHSETREQVPKLLDSELPDERNDPPYRDDADSPCSSSPGHDSKGVPSLKARAERPEGPKDESEDIDESSFPNMPDEWPQFSPVERMRNGVPYHRLQLEEKLRILEFLLDELLSVDFIAAEFTLRDAATSCFGHPYGALPSKSELESLENQDECAICGKEGDILCCDGCIRSYHNECIGMRGSELPQGKWLCPECLTVDPCRFGPLRGGSKSSLDWFTLNHVKTTDTNQRVSGVANSNPQQGESNVLAIAQAPKPLQEQEHSELVDAKHVSEAIAPVVKEREFLVIHGFLFSRPLSDSAGELCGRIDADKEWKRQCQDWSPVTKEELYEILERLGPSFAGNWPFSQIPLEPSRIWSASSDVERSRQLSQYFLRQDAFDPSWYSSQYRFAPFPRSFHAGRGTQNASLVSSEYESACCSSDIRALTSVLTSNMSLDDRISELLRSSTVLFNPYEMIVPYLVQLETFLRKGCLLDENWGIKKGVYDAERWCREMRKCSSINRMSRMMVDLIDACHARVFLDGWFDVASPASGGQHTPGLKDLFVSTAASSDARHYEFLPTDWTPEGEQLCRRWQRALDCNLLSLLSKESIHFPNSAHSQSIGKTRKGRKNNAVALTENHCSREDGNRGDKQSHGMHTGDDVSGAKNDRDSATAAISEVVAEQKEDSAIASASNGVAEPPDRCNETVEMTTGLSNSTTENGAVPLLVTTSHASSVDRGAEVENRPPEESTFTAESGVVSASNPIAQRKEKHTEGPNLNDEGDPSGGMAEVLLSLKASGPFSPEEVQSALESRSEEDSKGDAESLTHAHVTKGTTLPPSSPSQPDPLPAPRLSQPSPRSRVETFSSGVTTASTGEVDKDELIRCSGSIASFSSDPGPLPLPAMALAESKETIGRTGGDRTLVEKNCLVVPSSEARTCSESCSKEGGIRDELSPAHGSSFASSAQNSSTAHAMARSETQPRCHGQKLPNGCGGSNAEESESAPMSPLLESSGACPSTEPSTEVAGSDRAMCRLSQDLPGSKPAAKPSNRKREKKKKAAAKTKRRSGRLHRKDVSNAIDSLISGHDATSGAYEFDQAAHLELERNARISKLDETMAHADEKELHWPVAGRKLFDPVGYLPPSEMKRLGRNAGTVVAPHLRYSSSYEVGEASVFHAWRKRSLNVHTFEDLLMQIRLLESFVDKEAIHSCAKLARRSPQVKAQVQKVVRCKQRDFKTGLMDYFILNKGTRRGCWVSGDSIDFSPLILELSSRIEERTKRCCKRAPQMEASSRSVSQGEHSTGPRVNNRQERPSAQQRDYRVAKPPAPTSSHRVQQLPWPKAETQLKVAECESDIALTIMQHQIDTSKLIVQCKELGLAKVPAFDIAQIRSESALKLQTLFSRLETLGLPPRDETYILALLNDAEKHATDNVKRTEMMSVRPKKRTLEQSDYGATIQRASREKLKHLAAPAAVEERPTVPQASQGFMPPQVPQGYSSQSQNDLIQQQAAILAKSHRTTRELAEAMRVASPYLMARPPNNQPFMMQPQNQQIMTQYPPSAPDFGPGERRGWGSSSTSSNQQRAWTAQDFEPRPIREIQRQHVHNSSRYRDNRNWSQRS